MADAHRNNTKRSKQVLQVISEHGPLTIDGLQKMILPEMQKMNLRKALAILRKKNLIRTIRLDDHRTFYLISDSEEGRQRTCMALQIEPYQIKESAALKRNWYHDQWCEYWISLMRRKFPTAQFIREFEIGQYQTALNTLQISALNFELRPDFLLMLPKSANTGQISIAFEIERSRKSDRRLLRKLWKYVDGTRIDGLIYICDSDGLSETIRRLYEIKLLPKTQRQKRFGENFFLFSDTLDGGGITLPSLFNARGKSTSFDAWSEYLSTTKWTKRRDEDCH